MTEDVNACVPVVS